MNDSFKFAQGLLTIGDLAERTGVAPATLRMWEQRHGFPVPERLPSGHRRYRETDVPVVSDVLRRREDGTRLDVAIDRAVAQVRAEAEPAAASVYAELRRRHPALQAHRLRKDTLKALSWAIEDEFCARATRPHLFGAFQRAEFWRPARSRWRELARVARSAFVLVDEPGEVAATGSPRWPWRRVADAPGVGRGVRLHRAAGRAERLGAARSGRRPRRGPALRERVDGRPGGGARRRPGVRPHRPGGGRRGGRPRALRPRRSGTGWRRRPRLGDHALQPGRRVVVDAPRRS
ncbi:MAG: MerR family DNA-binding transcriptional regulator [Nocardioides sp.]|nr:MerR family DNA-binding transcriptional regulator [Nocardioides sp.]